MKIAKTFGAIGALIAAALVGGALIGSVAAESPPAATPAANTRNTPHDFSNQAFDLARIGDEMPMAAMIAPDDIAVSVERVQYTYRIGFLAH